MNYGNISSWEPSLIMNDISKQKYNSISLYHPSKQVRKRVANYRKVNKQNKTIFPCLNKIPKNKHDKRLNYKHSSSNLLNIPSCKNISIKKSIEPTQKQSSMSFQTVTQKGIILNAFTDLNNFIKGYFQSKQKWSFYQDLTILRQLKQDCANIGISQQLKLNSTVILDPVINIIYHCLVAQIIMSSQRKKQIIQHYKKAFYYSLKVAQFSFAIYSAIELAEVYKSVYNLQKGLEYLKIALGISIRLQNSDYQQSILQRIGLFFYYTGNTIMGQYYHSISDRGFTISEQQFYKKQFNLESQLFTLEDQLFKIKFSKELKEDKMKKQQEERQRYHNIQNSAEQKTYHQNKEMLTKMIKNISLKTLGQRLKGHIKSTQCLAKITPHHTSPPKQAKNNQSLPYVNVCQILKSHLSRNRGAGRENRDCQIKLLLKLIDSMSFLTI